MARCMSVSSIRKPPYICRSAIGKMVRRENIPKVWDCNVPRLEPKQRQAGQQCSLPRVAKRAAYFQPQGRSALNYSVKSSRPVGWLPRVFLLRERSLESAPVASQIKRSATAQGLEVREAAERLDSIAVRSKRLTYSCLSHSQSTFVTVRPILRMTTSAPNIVFIIA